MFLRTVATFFDVVTFLACLVGAWQIYTAFITPDANAVQVSAGVLIGIAIAAVPYFIAGAFHRGAVRELLVEAAKDRDD
jgi:hypothetical protein